MKCNLVIIGSMQKVLNRILKIKKQNRLCSEKESGRQHQKEQICILHYLKIGLCTGGRRRAGGPAVFNLAGAGTGM